MLVAGEIKPPPDIYDEFLSRHQQKLPHIRISEAYFSASSEDSLSAHIEEVPDDEDPATIPNSSENSTEKPAEEIVTRQAEILESALLSLDFPEGLVEQELQNLKLSPTSRSPKNLSSKQLTEESTEVLIARSQHQDLTQETELLPASPPDVDFYTEVQKETQSQPIILHQPVLPEPNLSYADMKILANIVNTELNCGGLTFSQWINAAQKYLRQLFEADLRAITLAWNIYRGQESEIFARQDDERMTYVRSGHRTDILYQDRRILGRWMNIVSTWEVERSKPSCSQVSNELNKKDQNVRTDASLHPSLVLMSHATQSLDGRKRVSAPEQILPKKEVEPTHLHRRSASARPLNPCAREFIPYNAPGTPPLLPKHPASESPPQPPSAQSKQPLRQAASALNDVTDQMHTHRSTVEPDTDTPVVTPSSTWLVRRPNNKTKKLVPPELYQNSITYPVTLPRRPPNRTIPPQRKPPSTRVPGHKHTHAAPAGTRSPQLSSEGTSPVCRPHPRKQATTTLEPNSQHGPTQSRRTRTDLVSLSLDRDDHAPGRERRGECRRRGFYLELPDGRVLRNQNRRPLLLQLNRASREPPAFEEEPVVQASGSRQRRRGNIVPRQLVSTLNKKRTYQKSTSLALPVSPPSTPVLRKSRIATAEPVKDTTVGRESVPVPPRPVDPMALVFPSRAFREAFRVLFRLLMTPGQAENMPQELVNRCATYLLSPAFTTLEEAEAAMFESDVFRTHGPTGDLLLLPSDVNVPMAPFEHQVTSEIRAVKGIRNSQGFALSLSRGQGARCVYLPVMVLDRLVLRTPSFLPPPGLHHVDWTYLVAIGPRDQLCLAFGPFGDPVDEDSDDEEKKKDNDDEGAMVVAVEDVEQDQKVDDQVEDDERWQENKQKLIEEIFGPDSPVSNSGRENTETRVEESGPVISVNSPHDQLAHLAKSTSPPLSPHCDVPANVLTVSTALQDEEDQLPDLQELYGSQIAKDFDDRYVPDVMKIALPGLTHPRSLVHEATCLYSNPEAIPSIAQVAARISDEVLTLRLDDDPLSDPVQCTSFTNDDYPDAPAPGIVAHTVPQPIDSLATAPLPATALDGDRVCLLDDQVTDGISRLSLEDPFIKYDVILSLNGINAVNKRLMI
ncbi:hypothetical protein BDY19DRAFT_910617 [Irpex rosettiformis]|uniref:Uncharacterized protein n=1 Tax=Irpex rosettiformis TaxID=378272 RepID=A0ACB8TN35_9APHY|nr:hypothetical protein BDY19DRAFT_910617 [Irpex rosettiformis]